MFELLEVVRIYEALKLFADLQGPICYNRVKFAYLIRINYGLHLETT